MLILCPGPHLKISGLALPTYLTGQWAQREFGEEWGWYPKGWVRKCRVACELCRDGLPWWDGSTGHAPACGSQRARARGPRVSLVAQLVTVPSQVSMRLASWEHRAVVACRYFGCSRSGSSRCSPVLFGFISGVSSILIAVCSWGGVSGGWGCLGTP